MMQVSRTLSPPAFQTLFTLLAVVLTLGATAPAFADTGHYGNVPDFSLTERSGKTVRRDDLKGQVWLCDFIYTQCPGPCPELTAKMVHLSRTLPAALRFVSFSVDPEHDTPAILQQYAREHGADGERWLFLTGDREGIWQLARSGFHFAVEPQSSTEKRPGVLHSIYIALVDGNGEIRGFYDSTDDAALQRLQGDALSLLPLEGRVAGVPLTWFPTIDAVLNFTSACFIALGWACIRLRRIPAHRLCMLVACASSTIFLVCYLTYHAHVGSVHFPGQGWIRPFYFILLTSHTILAAATVPLVLTTLSRALRGRFEKHVPLARWTVPIWLYVSCTGVVVYWLLYHVAPSMVAMR